MGVEWDYGSVAAAFDARPAYEGSVIDRCLCQMDVPDGSRACDVGAGTGRLSVALLGRGLDVVALEPNEHMRTAGLANTRSFARVRWIGGRAEHLPLADRTCSVVGFGSSFNVVERTAALAEAARVLVPDGALLCVWNHRRLDHPLQARIEALIRARVPAYAYGPRRDDQSPTIVGSGFFRDVRRLESEHVQRVAIDRWMAAWASHLTLRRQAGLQFDDILKAIGELVRSGADDEVNVPYVTRVWTAKRRR
jgi:SAM-dependent methyltransferase